MAKKTLEEKIELVCWWALGLTILYFLVGAFLISDGPKFDPTKTYNLLKDTLTLTAAFLAPAFAFVLFSSWKEQHFQTKIEKDAQYIYEDIVNYLNQLHKLQRVVSESKISSTKYSEVREQRGVMLLCNNELNRKIEGFGAQSEYKSDTGSSFYNKSKDVYRYLYKASEGIGKLVNGFSADESSEELKQNIEYYDQVLFDEIYFNLDESADHLRDLTQYKSQVKSKTE
ncbi:hypothetical protein [uncultured Acinetobacter sp.]|uniref:hypothetical protein n=1 Tax=uncultured Acinetobacter sp. TaxID=165433 RepID=UPI00258832BF|nr:hypothetical protein [uncultured Acinetobacter sp.]